MKYKVTINQKLTYTETIVGEFDDIKEAFLFIMVSFESCKNINVSIEQVSVDEAAKETD